MPIKPENRGRYPRDWLQIRARIQARACNGCEQCGVRNYDVGYRYQAFDCSGGDASIDIAVWRSVVPHYYFTDGAPWTHARAVEFRDAWNAAYRHYPRALVIVCTTAHRSEPIEDCSDENLLFLCQRCHNRMDALMRRANARQSRRAGRALGELL